MPPLSLLERHAFAKAETLTIFKRVWIWVIVGVGLGAALHGFVPDGWIASHLCRPMVVSAYMAVSHRHSLYSNATAVIPVMESLDCQWPARLGRHWHFNMSTVAAGFV